MGLVVSVQGVPIPKPQVGDRVISFCTLEGFDGVLKTVLFDAVIKALPDDVCWLQA
jgi:hypothetical protein